MQQQGHHCLRDRRWREVWSGPGPGHHMNSSSSSSSPLLSMLTCCCCLLLCLGGAAAPRGCCWLVAARFLLFGGCGCCEGGGCDGCCAPSASHDGRTHSSLCVTASSTKPIINRMLTRGNMQISQPTIISSHTPWHRNSPRKTNKPTSTHLCRPSMDAEGPGTR